MERAVVAELTPLARREVLFPDAEVVRGRRPLGVVEARGVEGKRWRADHARPRGGEERRPRRIWIKRPAGARDVDAAHAAAGTPGGIELDAVVVRRMERMALAHEQRLRRREAGIREKEVALRHAEAPQERAFRGPIALLHERRVLGRECAVRCEIHATPLQHLTVEREHAHGRVVAEEREAERTAVGLLAELQVHARTQRPARVVRPQVERVRLPHQGRLEKPTPRAHLRTRHRHLHVRTPNREAHPESAVGRHAFLPYGPPRRTETHRPPAVRRPASTNARRHVRALLRGTRQRGQRQGELHAPPFRIEHALHRLRPRVLHVKPREHESGLPVREQSAYRRARHAHHGEVRREESFALNRRVEAPARHTRFNGLFHERRTRPVRDPSHPRHAARAGAPDRIRATPVQHGRGRQIGQR